MHDDNYDRQDKKCIKYESFIEELEKHRVNFEIKKDTKLYSRDREIQGALDHIYRFIKMETHYAPAWLFNHLSVALSNQGRPTTYSMDDRIFFSEFIDMLVKRGSPVDQAIRLIAILKGDKAITSGFMKELRDTYRVFKEEGYGKVLPSITDIGETISYSTYFTLSGINQPVEKIDDSLTALRAICNELITYLKANHALVAKHEGSMYPKIFGPIIDKIKEDCDDPLKFFYNKELKEPAEVYDTGRGIREFLYSIEFFMERKLA